MSVGDGVGSAVVGFTINNGNVECQSFFKKSLRDTPQELEKQKLTLEVGRSVGLSVGRDDGEADGLFVGLAVGRFEGCKRSSRVEMSHDVSTSHSVFHFPKTLYGKRKNSPLQ